ncbi:macro domain-containing protein [Psychrobacter piscatorii]|uniref:Thoeris protein ThsA Macro domain-containing protein n=1 Tax=Psychrobacter piscatorii TaxID=554343 RepID=A0A0T6DQT1_9GAMM|nr:macro domain-containing protein [Psychrobacter piscatorii]KRU21991.1 hypothetical protein AS194_02180 [Psychrobacter piscatorii]
MKVHFYDRSLWNDFYKYLSAIGLVTSTTFLFITTSDNFKIITGGVLSIAIFTVFLALWFRANSLKYVKVKIDSTSVEIKEGDLFEQEGLIAIGFNEYFDTVVDDKIISKKSLNGIFIDTYLIHTGKEVDELDVLIENGVENEHKAKGKKRKAEGKLQRYKLGAIYLLDDRYILTAFTKFNDRNEARLTMSEYLEFLVNFWDNVNSIYAQRSVSVPIFGGGITRFKEHKTISDEELLKIMLWTFKISEMRFKHPARLTIIIHPEKIKAINLNDIKGLGNGL